MMAAIRDDTAGLAVVIAGTIDLPFEPRSYDQHTPSLLTVCI
jgi:hypothetical protein